MLPRVVVDNFSVEVRVSLAGRYLPALEFSNSKVKNCSLLLTSRILLGSQCCGMFLY
jgi:hypothetical protein